MYQHQRLPDSTSRTRQGPAAPGRAGGQFGGLGNAALATELQSPFPAIGSDLDAEEAAADQLAEAVLEWVGHADGGLDSSAPGDDDPFPAGFADAFQHLAGTDIHAISVHEGAHARTDAFDAKAYAHEGEVHLSGSLKDDLFTLAHELAHVALGHAAPGAPVRREAATTGDTGIGLSGYLRYGDRGSMVETLQTLLVNLGYMTASDMATGPGIFGRRTQAAVMAFQRAQSLTVDGIVGPQTIGALTTVAPSASTTSTTSETTETTETTDASYMGGERGTSTLTGTPALREGMEGVLVKELQKLLNDHGGGLLVDGEFGPRTASAVRAFQSANALTVDAIVGPQTASALTSGTARNIAESTRSDDPSGTVEVNVDDADPKGLLADSRINPTVRALATETIQTMQERGYSPYVVGGFRSFEYQDDLYEKGRSKPGDIVTYVRGGGSWHNYGLAVDIVFWNRSHTGPSWDGGLPWAELGSVGKAAGFTRWMGDEGWDFAHFEHHPSWGNSCYDLADVYKNEGLSAVWDRVM